MNVLDRISAHFRYDEPPVCSISPTMGLWAKSLNSWVPYVDKAGSFHHVSSKHQTVATTLERLAQLTLADGSVICGKEPQRLLDAKHYTPWRNLEQIRDGACGIVAKTTTGGRKYQQRLHRALQELHASIDRAQDLLTRILKLWSLIHQRPDDEPQDALAELHARVIEADKLRSYAGNPSYTRCWSIVFGAGHAQLYARFASLWRCRAGQLIPPEPGGSRLYQLATKGELRHWTVSDSLRLNQQQLAAIRAIRDLSSCYAASLPAQTEPLLSSCQRLLDEHAQLSDPFTTINACYVGALCLHQELDYERLLHAGQALSLEERPLYQQRISHLDPETICPQEQVEQMLRLDHAMIFAHELARLSGESRLKELLRRQIVIGLDLDALAERLAEDLIELGPADPSVAMSMDMLAVALDAFDAAHAAKQLRRKRSAYLKEMERLDQSALQEIPKDFGAEPNTWLACGSEELAVQQEVLMRFSQTHPGFFEQLARRETVRFRWELPCLSCPRSDSQLPSSDSQMTPVLLRCIVALHYDRTLPAWVHEIYGGQVQRVLGWLYPGASPPFAFP